MDYNDNQNQNGSGSYSDNTQPQNTPHRPVVVNELEHKKDSLVTIALVLGILGIVFCWIPCFSILICLGGLILGIISIAKTDQHRGISVAGIVTSAIGLVLSVLLNLLYIILLQV